MAGVNKAIIVGHLGKDPEVRYTPQGKAVANFSVATSESWTDQQGQKQDKTEWHAIVVWGKTAELCGQYLAKGRLVYIEGRLQTREWNDKDGNKRRTTEILADKVTFLSPRGETTGVGAAGGDDYKRSSSNAGIQDAGSFDYGPPLGDDDVPF